VPHVDGRFSPLRTSKQTCPFPPKSDGLARSTFDLFAIVKQIVDAEAQFRSLAEPWADTGTSTGRLMIAVLGGLADVERDLIRTRTAEGRSRAKARGKHMGRPPFPDIGTAERGRQTPRARRYVAGIGAQLQCRDIHHPPCDPCRMSNAVTARAFIIGHDLFHCPVIAKRPACPRCKVARKPLDARGAGV
jgi:hypothetical protein